MLQKLHIEQFVIIDKLDLDFQSELTILTGETGAGKSILLGALGLVLGAESDPESIRQGSEQSVIEASFAPSEKNGVWAFLTEEGLIESGAKEFTVHRTMKKSGSDDIRLSGKPVERETLQKIGVFLVEIHGQFANQSLLGPANQLHLLDLSGRFPPEVFKNVADALHAVHRFQKELEEEKLFLVRHKKQYPMIEKLVRQFNDIGMKEGFLQEVQEEYARLLTAKETMEAFQDILGRFISANGVVGSMSAANNTLAKQGNLNKEKVAPLAEHLSQGLAHARKAVTEIGKLSPEYEMDLDPLYEYEEILRILKNISTEHKIEFNALYEFYLEMSDKLSRLKNGREKLVELEDALIEEKNNYRHHAHILTEHRIKAGEALSKSITAEFAPLMLMKAEFDVTVEEKQDIEWTELGFNEVTFIARMNPGTPFSPISETASGGELARMILALKVVLQRVQATPTLVFDEVDTGIGGAAAAAVGERLGHLADGAQVLVITHSPQVASRGDQHLHISKKTDGVTTTSAVNALSLDQRIDEISRMLAGDALTDESYAAAKRLISEASAAAEKRRAGQGAQA